MAVFRKIVVKNKTFFWLYSFDDYDYSSDSGVIIKDQEKGKGKWVFIRFCLKNGAYCPFNEGLSALKKAEKVVINLNRPKYIAEMLEYILDYYLQTDEFPSTVECYDGFKILNELGYVFDSKFITNNSVTL
jgi:hypothetical protein